MAHGPGALHIPDLPDLIAIGPGVPARSVREGTMLNPDNTHPTIS
ncbi:MAG TPA: hypothetical protein VFZ13_11405 [Gemmatimonadales bacterium]